MATATASGRVTQVIGSTFDAEFDESDLPAIYNAIKIENEHKGVKINLTGEVQQHLGGGRVRCVALGGTDGLVRGMDVLDTGAPVTVPVGKGTLVLPVMNQALVDPAFEFLLFGAQEF